MTGHVLRTGLLMMALTLAGAIMPAGAQISVTNADIQRLQDTVFDIGADIAQLRNTNPSLAEQLQRDLDQEREEVIYLKVKLRKELNVSRSEYVELRDRLAGLRSRARGETFATRRGSSSPGRADRWWEVPAGTELDVRLEDRLYSDTAKVEDRFEATTLVDFSRDGHVLIPAGSVLRGMVTGVHKASRTERKGSLTVSFDQITINGRAFRMRGTVTQALESEGLKGETGRIAAGAGVGAVIGGILGGTRGALAGILIGAGGTLAATEGKDVDLRPGTVLRVRIDTPIALDAARIE